MILPALAFAAAPQSVEEARDFLAELGLGKGAFVADVGAGHGELAWAFSDAVGRRGEVWLEDVRESLTENWDNQRVRYENTHGVIGTDRDPLLPEAHFDLVVCRDALHEFTRPAEMLGGICRALKPGGFFAVVDRHIGPVVDRVPFEQRGETHAFLAEPTLARLAWEAGLEHHSESAERLGLHFAEHAYTHVFHRPVEPGASRVPLDLALLEEHVRLPPRATVALAAHDPTPDLPRAWLAVPNGLGEVHQLLLDEWLSPGAEPPAAGEWIRRPARTRCGVVDLSAAADGERRTLDAVLIVDAYHALFYEDVLLRQLRARLRPGAPLAILDRRGDPAWPRMHCALKRAIDPARVAAALARQGFSAEVHERGDTFLVLATATEAPPSAGMAPIAEVWRHVFERVPRGDGSLLLLGDEPGLERLLPELGYDSIVHSSIASWDGARGDPIQGGTEEHDVLPFPLAPLREFEVAVAVDYDVLPDPRVVLGAAPTLLLVRRPEGRRDGHPSTESDFGALPRPLDLLERVTGDELGCPDREVWILRRRD